MYKDHIESLIGGYMGYWDNFPNLEILDKKIREYMATKNYSSQVPSTITVPFGMFPLIKEEIARKTKERIEAGHFYIPPPTEKKLYYGNIVIDCYDGDTIILQ